MRVVTLSRRLLTSLAIIAAAVGVMAFGTFGTFEDTQDHFPRSVAHVEPAQ